MTGGTNSVETLRWRDGGLEMIDQRHLPASFSYIRCDSAEDVAAAIRSMVVRGAPAIGVAAAYGVALEAQCYRGHALPAFNRSLKAGIELLAASRPTAVNLFWALSRMEQRWQQLAEQAVGEIADELLREAQTLHQEDIQINRAMGSHGEKLLPDQSRILTHCNAGALATAGYGTALGAIRAAVENGKNISVIASETRPFLQGARLTAWELQQDDIPVTLITDNMAGFLMNKGEIDRVIVGADRVAANGDVANKIGTYTLAVLAEKHSIPFYVACPVSTIDPKTATGRDIEIEERPAHEVTGFANQHWAPKGIHVRNPAFDVTPAELVTALITEKGVIEKPNQTRIAALFSD